MPANSAASIAAEGWMMKKKKSLLSVLSTRYFILTSDGKFEYYKSKPAAGAGKPDGAISEDVAQCSIGPAKESDMIKGNEKAVAYSFVIAGPGKKGKGHHSTLLVTNGPSEFRKWIGACRGMGTKMLDGVDANVKDVKKAAQDVSAAVSKPSADAGGKPKPKKEEAPPSPASPGDDDDAGFEEFQAVLSGESKASAPAPELSLAPPSSIKRPDGSVDASEASLHVSFKPEDEEIVNNKGAPQAKLEVSKSVSFSEGEDVVIDDDEMGLEEAEAEAAEEEVAEDEVADVVEVSDVPAKDANIVPESPVEDTEAEEVEETPVAEEEVAPGGEAGKDEEDELAKKAAEEELAKRAAEEEGAKRLKEEEEKQARTEAARKRMAEAKARSEARRIQRAVEKQEKEEPPETEEQPVEKNEEPPAKEGAAQTVAVEETGNDSDEKLKVFAYGDTYDEMTEALDSKKVLFGVMTTSIEDLGDDEAYLNSLSEEDAQKLVAISIEYEGSDAHYNDVKRYKNKLHEIGPLCKGYCNVDMLYPIVYEHADKAKEQILTILGAGAKKEEEEDDGEYPGESRKKGGDWVKAMGITYDNVGVTSYKHAINTQGVNSVPNGPDLLAIVRDKFGQPYNWVLFRASKKELIVEDAGSGGVMEMAKVVNECYSDKVLFGLARLSFSGDFGLNQFWCALEWKGPNCSGVKAMMAFRESLKPMMDMIGRRSFTLSNDMTSDMTPGLLVDLVKKSQNVGRRDASVTVSSMKNAHLEEQKAIEKYWKRQEEKEKALKQYKKETKDKAEEGERTASLTARDEKLAKMKPARAARREKWSKSTAPEILQSLGEESLTGWVLLEVNLAGEKGDEWS